MTKLLWDKVGERLYEAGVDRGVLYLPNDNGVAWNGLISVEEDMGDDASTPNYFDGVKYLDNPAFGDFVATLSAFTYPDEFLPYEGVVELGDGLYVDDQDSMLFGMSFRTMVGNDVEGIEHGYQVHLLYNLTAVPESSTYETLSNVVDPMVFQWSITGIPSGVPGYRPTAHVILDSRFLPVDVLEAIETILYGSGGSSADAVYDGGTPAYSGPDLIDGGYPDSYGEELPDVEVDTGIPRLPSIPELVELVTFWGPRIIFPDPVTGLSELIPGLGDLTQIKTPGIYVALPGTSLVETSVPGLYELT